MVEVKWRLGDEVMALPIYGALRAACPGCRLTVLRNYPELLEGNPFVDAVNRVAGAVDRYIPLRSAQRDVYRPEHYARPIPGTPYLIPNFNSGQFRGHPTRFRDKTFLNPTGGACVPRSGCGTAIGLPSSRPEVKVVREGVFISASCS